MNANTNNKPSIFLPDPCVPLVVFWGPHASGKTMTMLRMARFLMSEGYNVIPIRDLRPEHDVTYHKTIDNFKKLIHSNYSPETVYRWGFMLIEVIKDHKCVCQMLDIPGNFCHDPHCPDASFPDFLNAIITGTNPKVWVIMLEPDWRSHIDRMIYVSKIDRLRQSMNSKDSVMLVLNKIDKTDLVRSIGNIKPSVAIAEVKKLYPNIFAPFMNQNPVTRIWKKYNCDFIPFQTGYYTQSVNGSIYQEGPREYCVKLWKSITKKVIRFS